jgi:hypothetical protein
MDSYIVDLTLSRSQLLAYYRGAAQGVVARARSGERVQFPVVLLRPHVEQHGVRGSFRLTVDANRRLQRFERLS